MPQPTIPQTHALLVIDDARLRRHAAAEAERLLAKIDRLEKADRNFFEVDQGLYQNWYDLTFREELRQLAGLREIATKLIRFHNWIVTLSQRQRIRPEEAYACLQEEELRYQIGDADERAEIDRARRRRDAGEDETRRERPKREKSEEAEREQARAEREQSRAWWSTLTGLSEEELRERARAYPAAVNLILEAVLRAEKAEHARIVLLLWGEASTRVKKDAARAFEQAFGQVIGKVLDQMRVFLRAEGEAEREQSSPPPGRVPAAGASSRDREEELKLVYRKLVRYLHPDKQNFGAEVSDWQKKTWNEGQDAYQAKDLNALQRLYRRVMLRLRKLDELTMGEILASQEWLQDELRKLEAATKEKKKAPFWKFSKRKDYFDLERGIRKELERDLTRLRSEIRKLRDQHESLRMISEVATRVPRRASGKKGHRRGRE